MGLEGRSNAEEPAPSADGQSRRLDDDDLIATMRAMSMGERLESGFELCELASELAGAARR